MANILRKKLIFAKNIIINKEQLDISEPQWDYGSLNLYTVSEKMKKKPLYNQKKQDDVAEKKLESDKFQSKIGVKTNKPEMTSIQRSKKRNTKYLKSSLNYIGGKYKILRQIVPLFPNNINQFVDLFAGGGNVGINVDAQKVYFNDNLVYLIEMYEEMKSLGYEETLKYIESKIEEYELSQSNKEGYLKFREQYNLDKKPLDLFVLIAYSFNHQIRFNNSHQYNNPFGKNRSSFNEKMKLNLHHFITRLNEIDTEFSTKCFSEFDFSILNENDFVYADPPYLITTGTYNDGKRGFKGWGERETLTGQVFCFNSSDIPVYFDNFTH